MANDPSPFDDDAVWSLAGSSSDGILYAVSVDPILLDVNLWNYNDIQRKWKLLVSSDRISAPADVDHYCMISAIYKEEFGRVDVFIESHDSAAYLFRFTTVPVPQLDVVLSAANDENIQFDGLTGPSLLYYGDTLVVIGCKREDHGSILRIYRLGINDDGRTFALLPVWRSNPTNSLYLNRAVIVGNRLILMTLGHVLCFTAANTQSTQEWGDPTVARYPWPFWPAEVELEIEERYDACPSMNTPDAIWMVAPTQVREVVVMVDGSLRKHREILESPPRSSSSAPKVVASATHLIRITASASQIVPESTLVAVPTLQYICMSKLCSTVKEFKDCKNEEDALRLGIPILTWRRFCR